MKVRSCAVVALDDHRTVRLTVTPPKGRRVVVDFHMTDADAVGTTLAKVAASLRGHHG